MQTALMQEFTGGCHCGNLRLELRLSKPPEEMDVRACQCSFCRKHDALSISDPVGRARITVEDKRLLSRYRFGLKIADFYVCARCGVYVAAVCETPAGSRCVVNVQALADRARFSAPPRAVDYEGETITQRLARRAARWMPAELLP